jgi:SAM-dependent methyltransferase
LSTIPDLHAKQLSLVTVTDGFPGIEREWTTRRILDTGEIVAIHTRIHQQYSFPQIDFTAWALERMRWRGDEAVLDVGCGFGGYFSAVRERAPRGALAAGDLSLRLLREMGGDNMDALPALLTLDAQGLPFPDGTFDVVLANHVLHHMPDTHRALSEIRRVLRPTGVLLAATNSLDHLLEFDALYRRAYMLLGATEAAQAPSPPSARRFQLENGAAVLARHFYAVARHDLHSALIFPRVEPVMEYLQCSRPLHEPQLPPGVTWNALMHVMEAEICEVIDHLGSLVVNKFSGVFVATHAGDFAAPLAKLRRAAGHRETTD